MSNEKNIAHEREFLNLPFHTSVSSNIAYKIQLYSYDKESREQNFFDGCEINFVINDCHKQISLEFDIGDKKSMQNSLFKIRTIKKMCDKMEKDLKQARLLLLDSRKRKTEFENKKEKL